MENRLSSASRQPASEREPRHTPQADSFRRKKSELVSVETAIKRIEDKKGDEKYFDPQFKSLLDKKRELSFSLLSKKEQEDLIEKIFLLKKQLAEFCDSSSFSEYDLKRQIIRLSDLVPPAVLEHAHRQRLFSKEETKAMAENFQTRYEATAKEAIYFGIKQLSDTFERIFSETNNLPDVLIFPDSSSRILRYAVRPLVEKIYRSHKLTMPREAFLKTFSKFYKEYEREEEIKNIKEEILLLKKEIKVILDKKALSISSMRGKRQNSEEYINLSREAQELQGRLDFLKNSLVIKEERLFDFEQEKEKEIFARRLSEIIKADDSSVLVIDDLVAEGRTFFSIAETSEKLEIADKIYYFSFLSNRAVNLDDKIPADHFSTGVLYEEENEGNKQILAGKKMTSEELNSPKKEWEDLKFNGFPFRLEKEKKTGVKKDQTSANPYVEISPLADPVAKRIEREKYAAWGKEAVEKIFAEKSVAGVKS